MCGRHYYITTDQVIPLKVRAKGRCSINNKNICNLVIHQLCIQRAVQEGCRQMALSGAWTKNTDSHSQRIWFYTPRFVDLLCLNHTCSIVSYSSNWQAGNKTKLCGSKYIQKILTIIDLVGIKNVDTCIN